MADPRLTALSFLTETAFAYVRAELKAGRLRIRRREERVTAIPSEGGSHSGCLPCNLHRSTAEAYLLLQGLADTFQEEGQIAPGTGGTIHLARALLIDAEAQAAKIGVERPELRTQALTLQGQIATLTPRLADEVKGEETAALARDAKAVWRTAYGLTHSYFRQDKPETAAAAVEHDPLMQWMQRVKDEDMPVEQAMAELKTILSTENEEVASHA